MLVRFQTYIRRPSSIEVLGRIHVAGVIAAEDGLDLELSQALEVISHKGHNAPPHQTSLEHGVVPAGRKLISTENPGFFVLPPGQMKKKIDGDANWYESKHQPKTKAIKSSTCRAL